MLSFDQIQKQTESGVIAVLKDRLSQEELCDFVCYVNGQLCKSYSQGGRDMMKDLKAESNG